MQKTNKGKILGLNRMKDKIECRDSYVYVDKIDAKVNEKYFTNLKYTTMKSLRIY